MKNSNEVLVNEFWFLNSKCTCEFCYDGFWQWCVFIVMANITEIAKELGIAPSTVSRALKKPELVSLDTRHKVLQMAEKLYGEII